MNRHGERALKLPDLRRDRELGARAGTRVAPNALERAIVRAMIYALHEPPLAIVLWNGEEQRGSRAALAGRLHIRDRGALWLLAINPLLHFGDLYSSGRIEVDGDLVRFLEVVSVGVAEGRSAGRSRWWWLWRDHAPRSTGLRAARDNIHHHYDLGNEFYRLWLDEAAMQYTCAYYAQPDLALAAAQRAKMDHVCRKLQLRAGQRVVEAGCGWGGFALHMARHYGVQVRAFNISHEQVCYARERAREQGLDGLVEYVEDDYRNITGRYDAFVSIGMLEHVGLAHYRAFGAVIDRCLAPHGLGLIHSIGRNRPGNMNAWIERRIFPGAYPPSLGQMTRVFEPYGFSLLDVENLRLHYAQTLRHWLARFSAHEDTVQALYDRGFVRAWRLYLAGSIAAFTSGSLQLFQVLFARERNNEVPRTRAHLYR